MEYGTSSNSTEERTDAVCEELGTTKLYVLEEVLHTNSLEKRGDEP